MNRYYKCFVVVGVGVNPSHGRSGACFVPMRQYRRLEQTLLTYINPTSVQALAHVSLEGHVHANLVPQNT